MRIRAAFLALWFLGSTLAASAKPVVMLDPGHGGSDRGVKVDGMDEAAYTLGLAQKVAVALRGSGFDARLTRDKDVALTPANRTAMASESSAVALVSLHVNYSYNTAAKGLRVFVPAPGAVDEPSAPLWEQSARLQAAASRALGQQIATALGSAAAPDQGPVLKPVQSLKLALFRGLSVPAAEVELDYASNPESLKGLLARQDDLAVRLASGIARFVRAASKGEAVLAASKP